MNWINSRRAVAAATGRRFKSCHPDLNCNHEVGRRRLAPTIAQGKAIHIF